MKNRRIQINAAGGPEVMQQVQEAVPKPGAGEVLIRHHAIGVNFLDVYHRAGVYPLEYPVGLGMEAAGVIEAVGASVSAFKKGDRVCYVGGPSQNKYVGGLPGAYADYRCLPADLLIALPDHVSFEVAAAVMLKGMTAEFMLHRTYPVQPGDTILVQAAAGGVGTVLTQWAAHLGAKVIGVSRDAAKQDIMRENGCDLALVGSDEAIVDAVMDFTDGAGVQVAYDGVGATTYRASLASLARRGMLVSFGAASGQIPGVQPLDLARQGSAFFTRPILWDYITTAQERQASAQAVFERLQSGIVKTLIGQRYDLADASKAHQQLEAGTTVGATVITP